MEFVLAQTLLRCVLLLVFLFFYFFYFNFLFRNLSSSSSSSLVLFFFPYKSLCSRSEIIRSPSDLVLSFFLDLIITLYQCIGQNSSKKLKQKEIVQTSKIGHGSQNKAVRPRSVRVPAFFAWNDSSP